MSGLTEIVVVVLLVAYLLARRILGQPAEGKRMLLLPAIISVIGITDIGKTADSPTAFGFLTASALISIGFGAWRGATVRVFERDGIAFMRYTWVTVVLWVVSFAVKFGLNGAVGIIDKSAEASMSNGLMLTLGLGILAEGVVVLMRALRTNSRIIWAKGKDGAPHTTSPFLDDLQNRARQYPGQDR